MAEMGIRTPVLLGLAIIAVFFGGLGAWAALAPLDSASIASGRVVVEGNRKTIQHLEGGIIERIAVRDGVRVAPGDLLVQLEKTQPQARLAILLGRKAAAQALEARLIAERDGASSVAYPASLTGHSDNPDYARFIEAQDNIFRSRRQALDGEISILTQRIAQFREEINGLQGQVRSEERQLALIRDELAGLRELFEKGFAPRTRILALEREAARIDGDRNQNIANIARAHQSIGEAELRINELKASLAKEAIGLLRDVQAELFDLEEQVLAARDVLRRTEVRASIAGTVVGLQFHTAGGVVRPGEPLMDIVPSGEKLVIEAQVRPGDIDVIEAGQKAQVRFTAFNRRSTVPFDGEVETISADSLVDKVTNTRYYVARVRLADGFETQLEGKPLTPGMQAEVLIVTGAQTAMDYMLRPIERSLVRAFREE